MSAKQKRKVYLAGQPNEYENNWKETFKAIEEIDCYDWEYDSNQTSPDIFFPEDLSAIKTADYMVANPGIAPSEGTWIEIGCFYAYNTKQPGDFCDKLIILWREDRSPMWSVEFVKKTGFLVASVEEAKRKLLDLLATEND